MKNFKYNYRFTNDGYSLFSEKELAKIEVVSPKQIYEYWHETFDNDILEKCSFIKKIVSHDMPILINDCGWGDDKKIKKAREVLKKI